MRTFALSVALLAAMAVLPAFAEDEDPEPPSGGTVSLQKLKPRLTPAPESHAVHPLGLWSRPCVPF